MINQILPTVQLPTVALLVGLIIFLIISFKLMQMITETIIVSVISALFYLGAALTLNMELTVNRVLSFSFIGSLLYVGFKSLSSVSKAVSLAATVPKGLYKIAKDIAKVLKKTLKLLASVFRSSSEKS